MAPWVRGLTCEPRTLTIWCSCTVTVKLHVSGQSRGHTLGKVWGIGVPPQGVHHNGTRNCTELYGPMEEPISDGKEVPLYCGFVLAGRVSYSRWRGAAVPQNASLPTDSRVSSQSTHARSQVPYMATSIERG